jgi:hypothetical protein
MRRATASFVQIDAVTAIHTLLKGVNKNMPVFLNFASDFNQSVQQLSIQISGRQTYAKIRVVKAVLYLGS